MQICTLYGCTSRALTGSTFCANHQPDENPSKSPAASPALQRTAAEAQFSVIGDELRKANDRLGAIEARLSDLKVFEEKLNYVVDAARNGTASRDDWKEWRTLIVSVLARMEERIVEIGAMQRTKRAARRRKSKHKGK